MAAGAVVKLNERELTRREDIFAVLRHTNRWSFGAHRDIIRSLKVQGQLALIREIADDESMHPTVRGYAHSALQIDGEKLLVEPVFRRLTPAEEVRVRSSLERI